MNQQNQGFECYQVFFLCLLLSLSHLMSLCSVPTFFFPSHWTRLSPCGRTYDHSQFQSFISQVHHRIGLSPTHYSPPQETSKQPKKCLSRTAWFGCPTLESSTGSRKWSWSENYMTAEGRWAVSRRVVFPEVRRWVVEQTINILHKSVLSQWHLKAEITNCQVLYDKLNVLFNLNYNFYLLILYLIAKDI